MPGEIALDIGCSSGYEAVGMQWFLQVNIVKGVDKDISTVRQFADVLRSDLSAARESVDFAHILQADREWWYSEAPQFFRDGSFPLFFEVDIAQPDALANAIGHASCGFAYCSNVLCHIHDELGPASIHFAIAEIMQVLRPGAWFVAQEPADETLEYFYDAFSTSSGEVHVEAGEFKVEYRARRKP